MRRFNNFLAAVALAGGPVIGSAAAQQMPGTPVGRPVVTPVGFQQPLAATPLPKVGTAPNGLGGIVGQTSPVDPKLVVAPYPTGSAPSNLTGAAPKSFWDRQYDRWLSLFGMESPTKPPANWTPGLGRRNKDRQDAMWRRD